MKKQKRNLFQQLISIAFIICGIVFISLGILLPKTLVPFYEKSIYQYLKQPLDFMKDNLEENIIDTDITYLYVVSDGKIVYSDNFNTIIKASPRQVIKNVDSEYGTFKFLGRTYYYNTSASNDIVKIAITSDDYIQNIRKDMMRTIFPVLLVTFLLILVLIICWSKRLIFKIEHLKEKVDNLDNDHYIDHYNYKADDELKALSIAIDNMRLTLKEQEEYKNQMYQNISHDFKTPLTVIKSHIEAIEDGILDSKEGATIINDQLSRLEQKVHSLLYLNKLNYIKDSNTYTKEKIDLTTVLRSSVKKFKIQRPDIDWEINILDKKVMFQGTIDMWEAIIDNLLNNFMRYADKKIRITVKNNRITFYNDGPNIDETIVSDIFTPYKKGINGQFGLGLSIVRKTVALLGYEVIVKNEKKGIVFIIK